MFGFCTRTCLRYLHQQLDKKHQSRKETNVAHYTRRVHWQLSKECNNKTQHINIGKNRKSVLIKNTKKVYRKTGRQRNNKKEGMDDRFNAIEHTETTV